MLFCTGAALHRQTQYLTRRQPVGRARFPAIKTDQACTQHLFNRPLCQTRHLTAQKPVDTRAVFIFGDSQHPPVGKFFTIICHRYEAPRSRTILASICAAAKASSDRATDSAI